MCILSMYTCTHFCHNIQTSVKQHYRKMPMKVPCRDNVHSETLTNRLTQISLTTPQQCAFQAYFPGLRDLHIAQSSVRRDNSKHFAEYVPTSTCNRLADTLLFIAKSHADNSNMSKMVHWTSSYKLRWPCSRRSLSSDSIIPVKESYLPQKKEVRCGAATHCRVRTGKPLKDTHKAEHGVQSSVYNHSHERCGDDLPGGSVDDRYVEALKVQNADQSS